MSDQNFSQALSAAQGQLKVALYLELNEHLETPAFFVDIPETDVEGLIGLTGDAFLLKLQALREKFQSLVKEKVYEVFKLTCSEVLKLEVEQWPSRYPQLIRFRVTAIK
ncbi:MAG TPA: hypothetical protein V6C84_18805 [Coleofasciculaceae cyanobacterium]|jgi:hypothetical protein